MANALYQLFINELRIKKSRTQVRLTMNTNEYNYSASAGVSSAPAKRL